MSEETTGARLVWEQVPGDARDWYGRLPGNEENPDGPRACLSCFEPGEEWYLEISQHTPHREAVPVQVSAYALAIRTREEGEALAQSVVDRVSGWLQAEEELRAVREELAAVRRALSLHGFNLSNGSVSPDWIAEGCQHR